MGSGQIWHLPLVVEADAVVHHRARSAKPDIICVGVVQFQRRAVETYQIDGLDTGGSAREDPKAQQAWAEWCNDVHGEFDFDFYNDSYRGHVRRQCTDTYQLDTWSGESELVRREVSGIRRDPRGHYELFVPLRDTLYVGGEEANQAMAPGEMVLVPIDAPFCVAHRDDAAALTLLVPFERIDQRLGAVPKRGRRAVPSTGTSRLTRDLLVGLIR